MGLTSDGGSSATSITNNPRTNETIYSYEDVTVNITGSGLSSLPSGYFQNIPLSRKITISSNNKVLHKINTLLKDDFGRKQEKAINVVILKGGYKLDEAKDIAKALTGE